MTEKKKFETVNYHVITEKDILESVCTNLPRHSEYFCIMLLQQGEIRLSCNLVEFTLKKNSLFFITPKLLYELKSVSSDSIMTGVVFNSSFMSQNGLYLTSVDVLEIFSSQATPHYMLNEDEIHTLGHLFELLKAKTSGEHDANPFNREIIRHCLLAVIFEAGLIYQRYRTVREVKLTRKEEITLGFLKQLFRHFKKERSVQFYADLLFITSRHLSQVIKETTGKTAGELIDEAVIMQARLLLGNPSVNIAQVAESLQFSDQSFFGKFFKKHMGISPSEYRINNRVLQNPPF